MAKDYSIVKDVGNINPPFENPIKSRGLNTNINMREKLK